ncbi:MAG: tetratricopeptide repeat protein [Desulfobacterales bacterium]|nr:tetratricopeptide repeat protein [Desulfobacterales bacterium]
MHYFKGLAYVGSGNSDQAKLSISKAIELNPDYFKARMLLSDLYLSERSFELSENQATRALTLVPGDYRARLIRARAYMGLNKPELAQGDLIKLIEEHPDNPTAYYQLGLVFLGLEKIDDAETYFTKAYDKNNKLIDAFLQKINILVLKENHEKALALCDKQLAIYKEEETLQAIVQNLAAEVYIAKNEFDQARERLSSALELDPNYTKTYETLARLSLSEQDTDDAIMQYQTILEKNPNSASSHMILGTLYESEQKYETAAEHYRKALEIFPEYAAAANNLAYHYLKRADNVEEGFRLARLAKENSPNDPGIMDTLGLAYYQKGLYGNAVQHFLDSLKIIPKHPLVNYHLGMAYHKKGDKEKALTSLKEALNLDDTFPEADNARQIIQELEK